MNIVKETLSYRVGYYNEKNEFILHNEDGPAYVLYRADGEKEREEWYFHGKIHNISGPAYVSYSHGEVYETFYVFGCIIKPSDFYTPGFVDAIVLKNS